MKLLPQKQLNIELQKQKKSEVDAGLFLAKKIDALRENLQDKQKEHDDALNSMRKEYITFVGEQSAKKERLLKEIKKAEDQLAKLRIPLDAEWEEVESRRIEADNLVEELSIKNQVVKDITSELIKKQDELTKKSEEIVRDRKETDVLMQRVKGLFESRQKEAKDLISEKESWEKLKEKEEREIARRKKEADNSKEEYESYLESVKQKERLLDLKLRKYQ